MKSTFTLTICALLLSFGINAQLTQINSNKSLMPTLPLNNGKTLLVSELDSTLWVTDGTLAGTFQLSSTIKHLETGGLINNKAVFIGDTEATGTELFVSDGTIAGTLLLRDIYVGADSSKPDDSFALLNGFLYFTASRPAEGREIWRTDGTPGGTDLFKDIITGGGDANVADSFNLFSNGTYLLFAVRTAAEGSELWTSNGTSAGTVSVKNINPGPASSNPDWFYKLNNIVIFQATDNVAGREYWKTDGTTGGTTRIKDINPGTADVNGPMTVPFVYVFNNKAFFIANDGVRGDEPWYTDGTEANTAILKDIHSGFFSFTLLANAVKVGNRFFFTSSDFDTRHEMWVSDGTPDGTTLFKSFTPADAAGTPFIFTPFSVDNNTGTFSQPLFQGDKFFFSAGTEDEGVELWVSDGTLDGTELVKNIGPGDSDGMTFGTYAYTADYFYFGADDGTNGFEPWRSNGTSGGTNMVMNVNPTGDSDPAIYSVVTNYLLITATNGDAPEDQRDLYVLQGVVPLPVRLTDFTVKANVGDAVLNWSTSQEINSSDFQVQRSFDGRNFTTIGAVAARGTTTTRQAYSFVDAGVLNTGRSAVYYRLNQRNKDGGSSLTRVLTLDMLNKNLFTVRILSNPAVAGSLPIALQSKSNKVQLSIRDVSGKMTGKMLMAAGNGYVNLDVSNLATGIYFLVADDGAERKVIKFIKQ